MSHNEASRLTVLKLGFALLSVAFAWATLVSCKPAIVFSNPPATLQAGDLVGIWEVQYGPNTVDRFILRADGTYKQQYQDGPRNYVFETPWNPWSVRQYTDGRVRVYLQGARYYPAGIEWAEDEGFVASDPTLPAWKQADAAPHGFYDPVANELVEMPRVVILNVQTDLSGDLLLIQMLFGVEGQNIMGAAKLRRVEAR